MLSCDFGSLPWMTFTGQCLYNSIVHGDDVGTLQRLWATALQRAKGSTLGEPTLGGPTLGGPTLGGPVAGAPIASATIRLWRFTANMSSAHAARSHHCGRRGGMGGGQVL